MSGVNFMFSWKPKQTGKIIDLCSKGKLLIAIIVYEKNII